MQLELHIECPSSLLGHRPRPGGFHLSRCPWKLDQHNRTLFTFKEDIPQKAQEIQTTIKGANYLRGPDKEQFAGKMAEVYAGVNEMHPFREGSGRATREFVGQLAKDAGYRLDYTKVDKQVWNEAAKAS